MSRNSSGTYTLPGSVNPVVTGTTILSDWANTTLADLANEITNSLDRGGRGGMLAPLRLTNGTAAAPSLAFASDTSTGLYRSAGGEISVVTGGILRSTFSGAGQFVDGNLDVAGDISAASLTVGLIDGNITGTAANITGVAAVVNGGTGASAAPGARVNLGVETAANGSTLVARGTTAQRDGAPVSGMFRYNTTLINFEGYIGSAWSAFVSTAVPSNFTAPQRAAPVTDNDLSFDLTARNNFRCTAGAPGTLTFTNIVSAEGQSGFILLTNAGDHAISAAATTKITTATLTAISATGTYLLSYFSNGTNVYVVASGDLT